MSDTRYTLAATWFRTLRDSICAEFEAIEAEYANSFSISDERARREATPRSEGGEPAGRGAAVRPPGERSEQKTFSFTPWERKEGGGGTIGLMKGRVFEKVGVNISTVHGEFSPQFRAEIPGADTDPRFLATGISLVAHPANPHVPAAHMNTRMIMVGGDFTPFTSPSSSDDLPPLSPATAGAERSEGGVNGQRPEGTESPARTTRALQNTNAASRLWFGGGGDLNPAIPYAEDTADFHAAFKQTCDATNPDFHPAFSDWCEEYFFLPHRNIARGQGGIFYDYLGLARLGLDQSPVTSGRFGRGGLNAERTQHGMDIANHAPLDWDSAFAFTRNVGTTFRDTYSALVRRRMATPYTDAERHAQLVYRGRYAEYNLLYDRGTRFGLMTGGNTEAILMSLPPLAVWE